MPHPHLPSWSDMTECRIERGRERKKYYISLHKLARMFLNFGSNGLKWVRSVLKLDTKGLKPGSWLTLAEMSRVRHVLYYSGSVCSKQTSFGLWFRFETGFMRYNNA